MAIVIIDDGDKCSKKAVYSPDPEIKPDNIYTKIFGPRPEPKGGFQGFGKPTY